MSDATSRPFTAAAAATISAAALWWLGRGLLATPPLHDGTALEHWLRDTDPVTAAFAAARAIAALLAAYLAIVLTAAALAQRAQRPAVAAALRRLVPATMRPLVGVVAATSVTASVAAISAPRPTAPATSVTTVERTTIVETATMELVETAPATSTTTVPTTTAPAGGTTIPDVSVAELDLERPAAGAAPATVDTWTIAPGDHLWAVAAETLADHWGRAPSDREITPYWRTLIETNRHLLVDADVPDLVLPGQVFVLPAVPAAPAPR